MSVLVVTTDGDVHAQAVTDVLDGRGVPVQWVDPGQFPQTLSVAANIESDGRLHGHIQQRGERFVRLERVTCAWYRRPSMFAFPDTVTDTRWAAREARQGWGGLLACLTWLNDPADIARAEYKPHQLHVAGRCGLSVPATAVTNILSAARQHDREHGPLVHKWLSGPPDGEDGLTRPVGADGLSTHRAWPAVQHTTHLVQQRIGKTHDVRLTVVDDQMFAVAIRSPHLDWRADIDGADHQPCPVPPEVAAGVRALLGRLRLRYAALDFSVDERGQWWFLEINPCGQWLWLDERLHLGIAEAIADALTKPAPGPQTGPSWRDEASWLTADTAGAGGQQG
jgi:ATP-grasp ribosomal peptide maturase